MKLVLVTIFSVIGLAQGQEWIPWKASQGVPKFAVPSGHEADYRPLYVVRAPVGGGDELAPGKYVAEDAKAYIPYKGKELIVTEFEVSAELPYSLYCHKCVSFPVLHGN